MKCYVTSVDVDSVATPQSPMAYLMYAYTFQYIALSDSFSRRQCPPPWMRALSSLIKAQLLLRVPCKIFSSKEMLISRFASKHHQAETMVGDVISVYLLAWLLAWEDLRDYLEQVFPKHKSPQERIGKFTTSCCYKNKG